MRGISGLLMLALLLAAAGGASAAELRRVEAVGAVPAGADAPSGVPIRRAALEAALAQAVLRVASDLGGLPEQDPALQEILGNDPLGYVARYRMLEDRGERRALLVDDPNVTMEYVVLVEAQVDEGRIRSLLTDAGILSPRERHDTESVLVVLEDVHSYWALAAIRERLEADPRVRSVVPQEFEVGRVALAVETSRDPRGLLRQLSATPPPGVEVRLLEAGRRGLRLQVVEHELPDGRGPGQSGRLPANAAPHSAVD
jgi:hypothetical protein